MAGEEDRGTDVRVFVRPGMICVHLFGHQSGPCVAPGGHLEELNPWSWHSCAPCSSRHPGIRRKDGIDACPCEEAPTSGSVPIDTFKSFDCDRWPERNTEEGWAGSPVAIGSIRSAHRTRKRVRPAGNDPPARLNALTVAVSLPEANSRGLWPVVSANDWCCHFSADRRAA